MGGQCLTPLPLIQVGASTQALPGPIQPACLPESHRGSQAQTIPFSPPNKNDYSDKKNT